MSRLRVLIADDNADMLIMLQLWLEADGHTVHMVASGAKVVRTVEQVRPDVCVLDIHMPGGNGFAIAKELKKLYGTLRPYLIALSGKFYSAADRLVALDAGFDDFLEKPASPRELSRILAEVARRREVAA
jgi:two-component system, OmpR family, response regulator